QRGEAIANKFLSVVIDEDDRDPCHRLIMHLSTPEQAVSTTVVTESAHAPGQARVMRIQASRGWPAVNLRELWRYRALMSFLAWPDVKLRYRQTLLGVMWIVLQPVAAMIVFTIFLGNVVRVPTEGIPYPLFALAGLVPWTYFSNAVSNASGSLTSSASLVSKVYFPRMAIPLSGVLSGLVDAAIGVTLLLGLATILGTRITLDVLFIPLFLGLALLFAAGIG